MLYRFVSTLTLFGCLVSLSACQLPESSGGLTQAFKAEIPVEGSIVFSGSR